MELRDRKYPNGADMGTRPEDVSEEKVSQDLGEAKELLAALIASRSSKMSVNAYGTCMWQIMKIYLVKLHDDTTLDGGEGEDPAKVQHNAAIMEKAKSVASEMLQLLTDHLAQGKAY